MYRLNKIFLEKLVSMCMEANRKNDNLSVHEAGSTVIGDSICLENGILIEIQLIKNTEWEYRKFMKRGIQAVLERRKGSPVKEEQKDSILNMLFKARLEDALEKTLRKDENYQKISAEIRREIKKIDNIQLNREQWIVVDNALSACNNRSSIYGKAAYYQGFQDAVYLLKEIYQLV